MTEQRPAAGTASAADSAGREGQRKQRFRQEALDRRSIWRALGPAVEMPPAMPLRRLRLSAVLAALRELRHLQIRRRRVPVRTQVENTDCGPTALSIVLAYHGIDEDLPTLRTETNAGRDGVSLRVLLDTARRYGLTGRGVSTTVSGLRGLSPGSILFWNFGHFVVLERVKGDHVDIVDPAHGRRRLTLGQVGQSFTGVALEFQPPLLGAGRPVTRGSAARPWRFLRFFFPRTSAWLPLIVASLVLLTLNLAVPIATYYVATKVTPGKAISSLSVVLVGLPILLALFFLLQVMRNLAILAMQTVTDKRVTLGVLSHLLSLPYEFFASRAAGDLALRVRTSAQVRLVLTNTALSGMFDGLLILVYMVLLLLADRTLALVVLAMAVLQVSVLVVAWKRQAYLAADALEAQSQAQSELIEMLDGLATLKSTGLDSMAAERWSHSLVEELNSRARSRRNLSVWSGASICVQFAAPLVVLLVGSLRIAAGDMSLGKVLGFSALALGWFVPLANLVQSGLQLSDLRATLARMGDILDAEPENDRSDLVQVRDLRGDVAMRDVSFRYPGSNAQVLSDVSFSVPAGELVVIVGESGSGKSTLAMLLAGLYLPASGCVLVDGVSTAELDRASLRGSMSFINQNTRLFAASIRDNVVWGTQGLTDEDIVSAAKIAFIQRPISDLPMGYDTLLGPAGVGLSGGQRQRVALTRALVRKPKLLILDEATGALDPLLEERVFANLTRLHCTLVVIAHRLTNLHLADRIIVMQDGRIVQQGTYEELQQQGGMFAKLSPRRPWSHAWAVDDQAEQTLQG